MAATRFPSATYRVQLNKDFRFADACGILDYLRELGISDLYLSPILASRKGSDHGYDVVDPTRINPELGTEEDFATLQTELQNRGMGLLLDIVPNHMAASAENPWWMDVLENGAQSAFAGFFDIEWHPHSRSLDGKILLPVLGRPFGDVLESGEIGLTFQEGKFFFRYFETLFPLAPHSYYTILNHRAGRLKELLGEESPAYHEYSGILASLLDLIRADRRSGETAADRRLRYEASRDRLWSLVKSSNEIASFVEDSLQEMNGVENDPASFGFLQQLLAEQNYKLAFWRNLNESINYRRFFTIAELVGLRVEDPHVFEATHGYILRLLGKNPYFGVRVDHIDGLRDPCAYLNKLQERLATIGNRADAPAYVLVEKILEGRESLPNDWPVNGTTGYDFLNNTNNVFVDADGARQIEALYFAFTGRNQSFDEVVYQKKKLVMTTLLGVEVRTLGRQLGELAAQDRYARELPRAQLIDALIEVTACLGIYRTYIRNMEVPAEASKAIEDAVTKARNRAPHLASECFDFVREVLLLLNPPHVFASQREARLACVMRWQQFTGPIVAKGLEDTALYVYHPLLSMNEVGGDPSPSHLVSREPYDVFLENRREKWPGSLNASSTHDTKRSEDVRARLNVLSEIPEEWNAHLQSWAGLNASHKEEVDGQLVPDRNEEYYLYQTLLGVWPLDQGDCKTLQARVQAHLIKATREGMVHTRWTQPNQRHEDVLQKFVAAILSSELSREFLHDFRQFQKKIAYFGMINGLSQMLLKIVSPGVPDFYQGSELWDLRLVDPDNRGPIDFARRTQALEQIVNAEEGGTNSALRESVAHWHDGRLKMHVMRKALQFRREHEELLRRGEIGVLQSAGNEARHVTALFRRQGTTWLLAVVPRWASKVQLLRDRGKIGPDWGDTRLISPPEAPRRWKCVLTGAGLATRGDDNEPVLMVNDLFGEIPVALLSGQTGS